jgi:predicted TIM-barrel fold metal-dependent hydrolase
MADDSLRSIPTIDTHLHLWDLERFHYPWLMNPPAGAMFGGTYDKIRRSYGIDDFLRDSADQNMVKAVHVEACCLPEEAHGETAWLHGIAEKHGYPHGIVGFADLRWPDVRARLEKHLEISHRFRGIRMMNRKVGDLKSNDGAQTPMSDSRWHEGMSALTALGLSFELQAPAPFMEEAYRNLKRHPDANVVQTHCGIPMDRSPEGMDLWRKGMRRLASLPNVSVKLSALGTSDHNWTLESIRPVILECIEIFGVDRAFFASNWPVDSLYSDFNTLYDSYRRIIGVFSPEEQWKLLHDNAAQIYRV